MTTVAPVGSTSGTQAPKGMSALTTEEFSKIIFTELANQDPLSPNDTGALLQQISTLRSIQSDMDLSDRLRPWCSRTSSLPPRALGQTRQRHQRNRRTCSRNSGGGVTHRRRRGRHAHRRPPCENVQPRHGGGGSSRPEWSRAMSDPLSLISAGARRVGSMLSGSAGASPRNDAADFSELLERARAGDVTTGAPVRTAQGLELSLSDEQLARISAAADKAESQRPPCCRSHRRHGAQDRHRDPHHHRSSAGLFGRAAHRHRRCSFCARPQREAPAASRPAPGQPGGIRRGSTPARRGLIRPAPGLLRHTARRLRSLALFRRRAQHTPTFPRARSHAPEHTRHQPWHQQTHSSRPFRA